MKAAEKKQNQDTKLILVVVEFIMTILIISMMRTGIRTFQNGTWWGFIPTIVLGVQFVISCALFEVAFLDKILRRIPLVVFLIACIIGWKLTAILHDWNNNTWQIKDMLISLAYTFSVMVSIVLPAHLLVLHICHCAEKLCRTKVIYPIFYQSYILIIFLIV